MLTNRFKNDGNSTVKLNDIQLSAKNELEQKMKYGIYEKEYGGCVCGNLKDFEIIAEKDMWGLDVKTVICENCGLIMINPRMNQTSYNKFYDNYYRKIHDDKITLEEYFKLENKRGERIFEFIKSLTNRKIENVLEIECGAGGILHTFKENGCNITGIDLDSRCINYGKNNNLNLIYGFDRMWRKV